MVLVMRDKSVSNLRIWLHVWGQVQEFKFDMMLNNVIFLALKRLPEPENEAKQDSKLNIRNNSMNMVYDFSF